MKRQNGIIGVSAKKMKIKKVFGDHANMNLTAVDLAEIDEIDNRGHKKTHNISIKEFVLVKFDSGLSFFGSIFDGIFNIFKR